MKLRTIGISLILVASVVLADDHKVDFDKYTNFSTLKTFSMRTGRVDSPKPELNNPLVVQAVGDAIRSQLVAKGLKESAISPDLNVEYNLTSIDYADQRGGPAAYSEGTVVVDLMDRKLGTLVWRGVYRDNEKNVIKLTQKFPDDVKKLLAEYPPKQSGAIPPRPVQPKAVVPITPRMAAIEALQIIQAVRRDTSYVGPNAHPGLDVRFNGLERAAQAILDDDERIPRVSANQRDHFIKLVNETAEFALGLANNNRESPDSKQKSTQLASRLRALVAQ